MIPYSRWRPLSLNTLGEVFSPASFRWGLAGGHCIEKFIGRELRAHGDVDIVILRSDQLELQKLLNGWSLHAADPPGNLREWRSGEYLSEGVHDIWGHRSGMEHWELQVMLQEVEGDHWYYRRDDQVSGCVDDLFEIYGGWPCVRIEIQLLYKSKGAQSKDARDFDACLPYLDKDREDRLASYLRAACPDGHDWIKELEHAP